MTRSNQFDLFGLVALVTGASRGLGKSIAEGLAGAGAKVIAIGRTRDVKYHDLKISYRACDVTDQKLTHNLITDIHSEYGKIDILVNAAGITIPNSDIKKDQSAAFLKMLDANLISIFELCEIVIPIMKKGGYGSIINVCSIGASLGFPNNPGYAASKGALLSLTRSLAVDHGAEGIRANSISPGYFLTDMTKKSYDDPELKDRRTARTILGRWGTPDEIRGAAIFLASDASSYITGTNLLIDGGWTCKGL